MGIAVLLALLSSCLTTIPDGPPIASDLRTEIIGLSLGFYPSEFIGKLPGRFIIR